MKEFTLKWAALAVGGKYYGNAEALSCFIQGVEIDNRRIHPGFLFVPIKGERLDGHDFIEAAYEAGAICCLSEKMLDTNHPYILVKSTLQAFQTLAEAYCAMLPAKIVGITGSVGKTTTKEMVASVLSQSFRVLKTEGNLNNQTGVPLTVFRMEEDTQVAVIEMGTNHFGEIASLAKIVRPDICLFTNIGMAHIEHLGSQEGILRAKSEMLDYMQPGGSIILYGDDPMLYPLHSRRRNVISFGLNSKNEVVAKDLHSLGLKGTNFTLCHSNSSIPVHVPSPGEEMVLNALAAAAAGLAFGMDDASIAQGIAAYRPVGGRMAICTVNNLTILDDSYNANPQSMLFALDTLADVEDRKVAILGDMYELGEKSNQFHREMGIAAAKRHINLVLCVGMLSKEIYHGTLNAGGNAIWYEKQSELIEALADHIQPGDTVLVKASRGMHLEQTVAALLSGKLG